MVFLRRFRNIFRRIKQRKIEWVYIDLVQSLPERPAPPRNFFMKRVLPEPKPTISFLRKLMLRLSTVKNVKGVIIHFRDEQLGNARIQSIRKILADFKATGKKVIAYANSYSFLDYYVATVADEIYIQPGGSINLVGVEMNKMFLKDLLDNHKIKFDALPISPYKSAADTFTRDTISEEDREQYEAIVETVFEEVIEAIMEKIGKSREEVIKLIDNAPYIDTKAKKLGLIEDSISNEELATVVKEEENKKGPKIYSWDQVKDMLVIPKSGPRNNQIAIISILGPIVDGESKRPPMKFPIPIFGSAQSGDHTEVAKIRKAMNNRNVKAVVLEVNSPGGSAEASEAIRSATKELTKKKPLVAYFNDVSASGGYYVSTGANYVVAQPMTLTGSIGVILGKMVLDDALDKKGIKKSYIRMGKHAGMFSPDDTFSESEKALLKEHLHNIYDNFVDHVAELIDKKPEEFEHHCRGRVWSGKDAHTIGLVNELGDLDTAIKKAAELAGLGKKYCVTDIYEPDSSVPICEEDGTIKFSLKEWLKPFTKTNTWYLMPEEIEIN